MSLELILLLSEYLSTPFGVSEREKIPPCGGSGFFETS